MNEKKNLSILTIAATYIGTVVGAGFATGQEVLQFFTLFGFWGILGLLFSTVLFIYFGTLIMNLAERLNASSHLEVIEYAAGKFIGKIIDIIITIFLFGALVIMAAGAGAIFTEQFGLSALLGNGLMILLTLGTVLLGLKNIIKAISFVVPFLLVAVLGVSLISFYGVSISPEKIRFVEAAPKAAGPNWLIAALLYVSYNTVLSVAVLAPLGAITQNTKNIFKGAVFGGLGLGLGAMAINIALLANIPQTANYEVPMVYLSTRISGFVALAYSIVLIMEVYTTAVGSLYGFTARLVKAEGRRRQIYAILSSIVAFLAAQFGFSNMVKIVFPAVGYAGLLLLGGLVLKDLQDRRNILAFAKPLKKNSQKVGERESGRDET